MAKDTTEEDTIQIQLYTDVDQDGNDKRLMSFPVGPSVTAESLCLQVARALRIGPRVFYSFALAKPDLSLWLIPNEKEALGKGGDFVFRIRFIPSDDFVTSLVNIDEEAYNYLYLQLRDDFVNSRVTYDNREDGKKISQAYLLGLSVIDILRWGKERGFDLKQMKNNRPKTTKFIPGNLRKSFLKPWDMKRLVFNLNNNLEKVYSECVDHSTKDIKRRFIRAFLNYVQQYGVETFKLSDGRTVAVDPYHPQWPGIYICKDSSTAAASPFAEIDDLMNITVNRQTSGRTSIQINRRSGMPLTVEFDERPVALSFVALLDGYYRLREDFHFYLCSDVYSELLKSLLKIGCYGPVGRDWAAKRLLEKHKQMDQLNYLVKQKSDDLDSYVLMYLTKDTDGSPKVEKVIIDGNAPGGQYKLRLPDEPSFSTVNELLLHYQKPDSHPTIALQSRVRPTMPVDPSLYLCRSKPAAPSGGAGGDAAGAGADFIGQNPVQQQHSTTSLVSGVSLGRKCLGQGAFTEVMEGEWDRKRGDVQKAAIKMLRKDAPLQALQGLLTGLHNAVFWHRQELLAVHALCLGHRMQAVLQLSPHGDLLSYFRHPQQVIRTPHLISTAEQLAQALTYLQVDLNQTHSDMSACIHGNIRCRNVLVFYHEREDLGVKLGDPGLVHYYNTLPVSDRANRERFAWLAPEQYRDLSAMSIYTDRYSYGVCLWEIFSLGKKPFLGFAPKQVMEHVMGGHNLPQPENCPDDIYNKIIKRCCLVDFEHRLEPKAIVREIREISSTKGPDTTYNIPTWEEEDDSHHATVIHDNHVNGQIDAAATAAAAATATRRPIPDPLPPVHPVTNHTSSMAWSGSVDSREPLLNITHGSDSTLASATTECTEIMSATGLPEHVPLGRSHIANRPLPERPQPKVEEPCESNCYELRPGSIIAEHNNVLGEGHYGKVLKGTYKKMSGGVQQVAIKVLKNAEENNLKPELAIMGALKHGNIVQLIGHCYDDRDHSMMLVIEYVEKGCLTNFLRSCPQEDKTPAKLMQYADDIAQGMEYLSSNKVVHRDLAARNVLVTKENRMKIADFGLSHFLDPNKDYYRSKSKNIPAFWCAPESLSRGKFFQKSDVWSFGVTLWEMFSGQNPAHHFKVRDLAMRLHDGERLPCPDRCPQKIYKSLMMKCWIYMVEQRYDFQKVCEVIAAIRSSPELDTFK